MPAAQSVDGVADEPGQAPNGNLNQIRKLKAEHRRLKALISLGSWTGSKDAVLTLAHAHPEREQPHHDQRRGREQTAGRRRPRSAPASRRGGCPTWSTSPPTRGTTCAATGCSGPPGLPVHREARPERGLLQRRPSRPRLPGACPGPQARDPGVQGWTRVTSCEKDLHQAAPPRQVGRGLQGPRHQARRQPRPAHRTVRLYDGNEFWSYGDPAVMLQKAAYIRLGGAMLWSIDQDHSRASPTTALHPVLN